jgi:integrase
MSVYRPKGSPFYQFDFQWRGRRFHGTTKRTNRREAETVERAEREKAKQLAAQARGSSAVLTLDAAAGRYWSEVGQHHVGRDTTWRDLERLIGYFGPTRLLTEISDDDVTKLIAWRRGHRVARHRKQAARKDAPPDPLVSNATVNRSTLEPLKKLFGRAKRNWGARFEREPNWKDHRLPEPQERVRELRDDEAERLEAARRADYEPFFAFAHASGLRLRECLLKWSEVDWGAKQVTKRGKGGKIIACPITPTIRSILWPLRGHDPVHVFTYVAQRTRGGRVKGGNKVKGARYPITYSGAKSEWKRERKRAAIVDFRFHDFRHDVGTKLLRSTGNLKLVQRALNHSSITTTTKYAHVLTDEVAAALDRIARSRNKSRNDRRKAG